MTLNVQVTRATPSMPWESVFVRGYSQEREQEKDKEQAQVAGSGNTELEDKHKNDRKIPTPALLLGVAGLIPMFTGALAVALDVVDPYMAYNVVFYQMTYAASVLSFMGAVHWGLAMADYRRPELPAPSPSAEKAAEEGKKKQLTPTQRNWIRYGFSVVPCLLAWSALAVPTQLYGMIAIMSGFTGVFIGDALADRHGLVPAWYMRLRVPLTIGVTLALGTSLMVHL